VDRTVALEQGLEPIITVAREYMSTPEDELELLLRHAWAETGLYGVPTRGSGREFWKSLREDLIGRAAKEQESVSVLTGMVAADVVRWVSEQGIPVDHYSYPIGLLVAWVTIGALKHGDDSDNSSAT
jgi:hypothetical protein